MRTGNLEKAVCFLSESGHVFKAKALLGSCMSRVEAKAEEDQEEDGFVLVPSQSIATASEYPPESGLQPRSHPNFVVKGNPDRDLWKYISWKICEDQGLPKWEAAVVGSTCHHRQSILNVAQTWEDKVRLKMSHFKIKLLIVCGISLNLFLVMVVYKMCFSCEG